MKPQGNFRDQIIAIGADPQIGFRFRVDGENVWFGLCATGHERPIFSGLVSDDWPQQLRNLALHVQSLLSELEDAK